MKTLIECEKNGVKGFKCGEDGLCFIGIDAKQKALRADSQKKADQWAEEPKESTVEFLKNKEEAQIEQEKLNALERSGGGQKGGDTVLNLTNNVSSNVDYEAGNNQLINKLNS